jgi:plastocyanin
VVALAGVVSRPAHAAATRTVRVKNYSYSEPDLIIDPGTEVTWIADQGDHTVTSEGGSFDEVIAQDYTPHSFSHTFDNPGRYTYYCGFHRAKGMEAVVEVLDPSGGPTTTEPPTTTTTWSPPTTTTTAPPATTTSAPATTTTAAPTATTSPPLPTSTAPVTTPASTTPGTTPPAAPAATTRPGQAGAAKGAVSSPVTAPTPAVAPAAVVAPTTTAPAPSDLAPAEKTMTSPDTEAVAAPALADRQQAGAADSRSGPADGGGPALGLLLAAGGLVAVAGVGTVVWRRWH